MTSSSKDRRLPGLWAPVYASMGDDPRTQAAAEVLVRGGVPRYVAVAVVTTAWARLHAHALAEGDDGRTGHLTDRRLVEVAWPEAADAPRNLGRRERLGALLRAALQAPPFGVENGGEPGAEPGWLTFTCGGCAGRTVEEVQGVRFFRCGHEALTGFDALHRKILRDRENRRGEASTARAPSAPDERAAGPASARRAASLSLSSQAGREGIPAEAAPAAPAAPARQPVQQPAARQHPERTVASLLGGVLGSLQPPLAPPAAGAAPPSRAPGADGEGSGERGDLARVRALVVGCDPNARDQARNGRDLTLRTGSYYLLRIGAADAGLRDRLERELGRDPAPGALLGGAAPAELERVVRVLAGKLPEVRNVPAYVRSTLATAWQDVLGRIADASAKRHHQAALEAERLQPPPAAGRTAGALA